MDLGKIQSYLKVELRLYSVKDTATTYYLVWYLEAILKVKLCFLSYMVPEIYAYLTVTEMILTERLSSKHLDHPEFCIS